MKNLLLSTMTVLCMLLIVSIGSAQTHFTATLTGNQENPAVTSDATGTGVFLLTDEGLKFSITVEGLEITNAHIHNSAIGANGGVARSILADFEDNTASGIWTSSDAAPLTDELIKDLLAGNLYVNIHTAANPGGEIRGQILLSSGTAFTANLTGDQENPAVVSDAKGTGFFTLTEAGLVYSISVDSIEITNAHFHNAAIGANGGVARSILADFVGNTASGIWTPSDASPLTDDLIKELLLGNIYVNIHTAANPSGEIRGQLNLSGGIGFTANLTGDQEVPAVTTDASGTASFTLTDAGLIFFITVEGLDITNAHFHMGAVGEVGGAVRSIFTDFDGNTASGVWRSTDTTPLTKELIAELLKGNIYVNVHTLANLGGEIRGQVNPNLGAGFTVTLTGDQENPPVAASSTGTGAFVLTDAGLEFSITVEGLDIANAHFHDNAIGANGGVVRGIMSDFDGNTASGIWTSTDAQPLTDELLAKLLAGNLYVNVHTAGNPGGEIRGQILLSSGTSFSARLTGDQENPGIVTDAKGTGAFTLTDAGLVYAITVEGLDITNAHFHNNAIGANGGVARGILADFDGNTAAGIWAPSDASPLTDEFVKELLAGNIYVNIHTADNPGGEIRGQVLLNAGRGFNANIMGGQEVPPVSTSASGSGAFTLTDAGLVFNTTVAGLTIANAHLHNAPFGENGGVVRGILADFDGNTASGVWSSTDGQPLTNDLIAELVLGNIYINVHTGDNPGGEIRGQLGDVEFITSVESVDDPFAGSKGYTLAQNTPNPFSTSTEIQFNLSQSGQTVLKIYNLIGKEITTLVNEDLSGGAYKVTFDSVNLPSGVYIYRLESNGGSIARKMIVKR